MLDFSWSHILIVLIVALVVVGPKELPRLMRTVGEWAGKARNMANEFRRSFDEMARQAELDELRAEVEALKNEKSLAEVESALAEPLPPDAAPVSEARAPSPIAGDEFSVLPAGKS